MRVIIDTDAGVDDSIGIVYAARSSRIKLEMITTVSGNVPVREVTQNVIYLKRLLELEVPVYSGADVPMSRKLVTAPEVHGEDGVGGYRTSHGITEEGWETGDAAMRIVHAARKHGRNLSIVSLGPMTNTAGAVSIDADAIRNVGSIIQMGGVFSGYGNTTPFTEFNIFVDPEAADFVLSSGIDVRFVPLDLTERIFMPGKILDKLLTVLDAHDHALAALLKKAIHHYVAYHRKTEKLDGCYLHDPIAVAAAVNPEWFRFARSSVSVETRGDNTSGMTISDFRKQARHGNSQIAVAFDSTKFIRDLTRKVFRAEIDVRTIKLECLHQRFVPDFKTSLQ